MDPWGFLKIYQVILEQLCPHYRWIATFKNYCFQLKFIFVEGILSLVGLDLWKNHPREPLCQSVRYNIPTGNSTLGFSEGPLDDPLTILYS